MTHFGKWLLFKLHIYIYIYIIQSFDNFIQYFIVQISKRKYLTMWPITVAYNSISKLNVKDSFLCRMIIGMLHIRIYIYIYIYMGTSVIWSNFILVGIFLLDVTFDKFIFELHVLFIPIMFAKFQNNHRFKFKFL